MIVTAGLLLTLLASAPVFAELAEPPPEVSRLQRLPSLARVFEFEEEEAGGLFAVRVTSRREHWSLRPAGPVRPAGNVDEAEAARPAPPAARRAPVVALTRKAAAPKARPVLPLPPKSGSGLAPSRRSQRLAELGTGF